jgi:hypothetical protein
MPRRKPGTPLEQLRHIVDALCEEPFESEAMDEDVPSVRAKTVRLALQNTNEDTVHLLKEVIAFEDAEHEQERSERKGEEKENHQQPPDETLPSEKK